MTQSNKLKHGRQQSPRGVDIRWILGSILFAQVVSVGGYMLIGGFVGAVCGWFALACVVAFNVLGLRSLR